MNNDQEMQFADPAWQSGTTQDVNAEQEMPPQPVRIPEPEPASSTQANATQPASEEAQEYAQGYRAQASSPGRDNPFQGPYQQPQAPSQGLHFLRPGEIPAWIWWLIGFIVFGSAIQGILSAGHIGGIVATVLIILIVWLLASKRVTINLNGERQAPETNTFNVETHPTILINNKAGAIHLRAGLEQQVSITTTRRGYIFNQRFNSDAKVWYNQDRAKNTISARVDDWKPFGKSTLDFDIVVPPHATLELVNNAGSISVQGINGQLVLKSDAGSINADQVILQGKSSLKTDAGSINFSGTLDPTGDYNMSTDLGSVTVTLPADASFSLDAKTDVGGINTNLGLIQTQRTKASGQVGVGPYPRLRLRTDVGSVNIYRR